MVYFERYILCAAPLASCHSNMARRRVLTLLLNDPTKRTLPLSVYQFFGAYGGSNWNLVFADLALAALPVVILFLFMQKQFISGLTEGAVKG